MDKRTRNIGLILVGVVILLMVAAAMFTTNNPSKIVNNPTPTIVSGLSPVQAETFSYNGEEGKDALTLLKETATVEQNSSGLVTAIDGRKAETAKKEYWAFYVNGKMAEVGPADYQTKTDDTIEWKVETY